MTQLNEFKKIGKGARIIVLHAACIDYKGFVPGSSYIFQANKATEDYHNAMNSPMFLKYFKEKILENPYIKEGAVIIIDNAPYHNKRVSYFLFN